MSRLRMTEYTQGVKLIFDSTIDWATISGTERTTCCTRYGSLNQLWNQKLIWRVFFLWRIRLKVTHAKGMTLHVHVHAVTTYMCLLLRKCWCVLLTLMKICCVSASSTECNPSLTTRSNVVLWLTQICSYMWNVTNHLCMCNCKDGTLKGNYISQTYLTNE